MNSTISKNIMNKPVTVITYGQPEEFTTRKEAIDFFKDCMYNSEGAEQERYVNVLYRLERTSDAEVSDDELYESKKVKQEAISKKDVELWNKTKKYQDKDNIEAYGLYANAMYDMYKDVPESLYYANAFLLVNNNTKTYTISNDHIGVPARQMSKSQFEDKLKDLKQNGYIEEQTTNSVDVSKLKQFNDTKLEARSHKEDNEKASPRVPANRVTAYMTSPVDDEAENEYWGKGLTKRDRVRSKEQAVRNMNRAENGDDRVSYMGTVDQVSYERKPNEDIEVYKARKNLNKRDKKMMSDEEVAEVSNKIKRIELNEAKKYGRTVWHTYNIEGIEYNFKCNDFETSNSWGHEVEFKQDYETLSKAKCNYYNRTWEMWQFQTCMIKALKDYLSSVSDEEEKARLNKLYDMIKKGDEGNLTEDKKVEARKYKQPTKTVTNNTIVDKVVSALKDKGFYVTKSVIEKDLKPMADDSILEQDVEELVQNYINDYQATKVENKKVTEDIDNIDDNETEIENTDDDKVADDENNTVSLLNIALNDIPKIGVEDWGKDNELNYLADTKVLFENLKDYEVEIPKMLVDNDEYEAVDEYLQTLGVDIDSGESDNTYNWGAPLTHDVNFTIYEVDDKCYFKASIHRAGDVRGNYTVEFLLLFDSKDDCIEKIWDICNQECANQLLFKGKEYIIIPNFFSEYVDIYGDNGKVDINDAYCPDNETFQKLIKEAEE